MKAFLVLLFFASVANAAYNPRSAKYDNNVPMQPSFDVANSVVYRITPAAATDPFSGKTNQYAESNALLVTSIGAAAHIKFGSTAPTASTSDFLVPANVPMIIAVDPNKKYMSVIQNAATATVFVVELY